jgi:hypothetical protein
MKAKDKKLQEQVAANQLTAPWKSVWRLYGPHNATPPEHFALEKIEVCEAIGPHKETLLEIKLRDFKTPWLIPCKTFSGTLWIEDVGNGCALIHADPSYGLMLLDSNV